MVQSTKTFRIFVSSTFSDLKDERNALQKHVFPKLRELCGKNGFKFQAIDLRWGISEEAGLDQQTMKICLEEIERSQKISPKPNFIVLLGDRYGWQPLPAEIEACEFNQILNNVSNDEEEYLLWKEEQSEDKKGWYRLDQNAVPPLYCLQPRTGDYKDYDKWVSIEQKIHSILYKAASKLNLSDDKFLKYYASATEQEIVKGSLDVENADEHVFCFFRNMENLPINNDFVDLDKDRNIDVESQKKLENLKEKLRKQLPDDQIIEYTAKWTNECVSRDHLENLCNDVYEKLERIILEQISEAEYKDPFKKEIKNHEDFCKHMAKIFVGRAEILQKIENYLKQRQEEPLTIHGVSGSGKTALMAYTIQKAKKSHPDLEVIYRFIGATPTSSDIRSLLYSLCLQIAEIYGFEKETVPQEYQELLEKFPEMLSNITSKKPLILFLDALDQLSELESARSLIWLPTYLPENVHIIVSTIPGECLDIIEKTYSNDKLIELDTLHYDEGEKILNLWLNNASRTLQKHQKSEILRKFSSNGLPLYLKLAFEEVKKWKSYTNSNSTVLNENIPGIIQDMLSRLSDDSNHGTVMVSKTLGYLATSRYGLSEDEILDILSRDHDVLSNFERRSFHKPPEDRLPVILWSRLYFDLEPYLTEHEIRNNSLLTFYHHQIKETIIEEYLKKDEKEFHLNLVGYFESYKHDFCIVDELPLLAGYFEPYEDNFRVIDELPWQFAAAKSWEKLYKLLSDINFFQLAYTVNEYDLKSYWAQIENNSKFKLTDAYKPCINSPSKYNNESLFNLSLLLKDTGHLVEACQIQEYQANRNRELENKSELIRSLGSQALTLADSGDLKGAMKIHKEEEKICRELKDKYSLSISLGNQAIILEDLGDLEGAMKIHKEQEKICQELGNKQGLEASLGNQANILRVWGDLKGAMELCKEQEKICREIMHKQGLQGSFGNQGIILKDLGDLKGAIKLYKEQEKICREIGNRNGIQISLGNQANILHSMGDLEGAMKLNKEKEKICQKIGNKLGLSISLGNQANVLYSQGDLEGAMKLYKEQEKICREIGYKKGIKTSLNNQEIIFNDLDQVSLDNQALTKNKIGYYLSVASLLYSQGDLEGAMKLYKEQEIICREIGYMRELQCHFSKKASYLYYHRDLEGAMKFFKEYEKISRELRDTNNLLISLDGQASILKDRGDLKGAMKLYKEYEKICRELKEGYHLSKSLGNLAPFISDLGDLEGAMKLYKEQEKILRGFGGKYNLECCLSNQASTLVYWGDLKGAMEIHKELEKICQEDRDNVGLSISLYNQALILRDLGDLEGAMKIFKDNEKISRERGDKRRLQASLGSHGNFLYSQGDLEGAMQLFKEQEKICRELLYREGRQYSLGGQASILYSQGNLKGAMQLFKEQERICESLGRDYGLSTASGEGFAFSLINQALIYSKWNMSQEAISLAKKAYNFTKDNTINNASAEQIFSKLEKIRSVTDEQTNSNKNIPKMNFPDTSLNFIKREEDTSTNSSIHKKPLTSSLKSNDEIFLIEKRCNLYKSFSNTISGKIKITNQRICFKSDILNFSRDNFEILIEKIVEVKKSKSFGFVPNAIKIKTRDGKKYKFVFDIWENLEKLINLINENTKNK